MKKTQKKFFGLLGLALVVTTTVVAASLPSPEASAADSFTDTIQVRVVGSTPYINITAPANDSTFVSPLHNIAFEYENVESISANLTYIDMNGYSQTYSDVYTLFPDYAPGSDIFLPDLDEYGYGDFVINFKGINTAVSSEEEEGEPEEEPRFLLMAAPKKAPAAAPANANAGAYAEDSVYFEYIPAILTATQDEVSNDPTLHIEYYGGGSLAGIELVVPKGDGKNDIEFLIKIENNKFNLYDADGNLIDTVSTDQDLTLPFSDYGVKAGTYNLIATPLNAEGDALYRPYTFSLTYDTLPTPITPDTGALFEKLNISRADYLLTGLIVFFSVAILGLIFTIKNHSKSRRKSPARRRH